MKTIHQKFASTLFIEQERGVLLLLEKQLDSAETPLTYLRYALTVRGTETPFFPSVALDDWGNEIKKLALYTWLQQEGERFPRAEIFGVTLDGCPTQKFLRDLELFYKYPCYAYPSADTPIEKGILVEVIAVPIPTQNNPERIKCPPFITPPLNRARVQWWAFSPKIHDTFTILPHIIRKT